MILLTLLLTFCSQINTTTYIEKYKPPTKVLLKPLRFIVSSPVKAESREFCIYDIKYNPQTKNVSSTLYTPNGAITKEMIATSLKNNFAPSGGDIRNSYNVFYQSLLNALGGVGAFSLFAPRDKKTNNPKVLPVLAMGGFYFATSYQLLSLQSDAAADKVSDTVIKESTANEFDEEEAKILLNRINRIRGNQKEMCSHKFSLDVSSSGVYGGEVLEIKVKN